MAAFYVLMIDQKLRTRVLILLQVVGPYYKPWLEQNPDPQSRAFKFPGPLRFLLRVPYSSEDLYKLNKAEPSVHKVNTSHLS